MPIAIKLDYLLLLVLTAENLEVSNSGNANKLHGKHAKPTARKQKTGPGAYDFYLFLFLELIENIKKLILIGL